MDKEVVRLGVEERKGLVSDESPNPTAFRGT